MPDDLSKLTPTDPSTVDPLWNDRRQSILEDVLTDTSTRRRSIGRWGVGIAAAAMLAVLVGGTLQHLRSEPQAVPAAPSASVSPISADATVAASGVLIDTDDGIALCTGGTTASRPPECGSSIPVSGITWDDLDWESSAGDASWAPAILVGTFDQTTFTATDVYAPYDPEAPSRPLEEPEREFASLCAEPTQGYGASSSERDLGPIIEELPGFQTLWTDIDDGFYNFAVTGDVARAREILEVSWSEPFCVGTLTGPTAAAMEIATEALTDQYGEGASLAFFHPMVRDETHKLVIDALLATPQLVSDVEQIVGPEVWPFTTISSRFFPLEEAQLASPSATDPSETTTSAFTDEQRGWAEETVAGVLESVGQPDKPNVTALVTEATYGQYMEVWNIDIPEPPGPPSDNDDVLVVAISGYLDGRTMRGGPPQLTTPDASPSPRLQDPIGTITVLSPDTGESLSHAIVVGGESPTDSIMKLPHPVEEVALPDGFR